MWLCVCVRLIERDCAVPPRYPNLSWLLTGIGSLRAKISWELCADHTLQVIFLFKNMIWSFSVLNTTQLRCRFAVTMADLEFIHRSHGEQLMESAGSELSVLLNHRSQITSPIFVTIETKLRLDIKGERVSKIVFSLPRIPEVWCWPRSFGTFVFHNP